MTTTIERMVFGTGLVLLVVSFLPAPRAHLARCSRTADGAVVGTYLYELETHTRRFAVDCPAYIELR